MQRSTLLRWDWDRNPLNILRDIEAQKKRFAGIDVWKSDTWTGKNGNEHVGDYTQWHLKTAQQKHYDGSRGEE